MEVRRHLDRALSNVRGRRDLPVMSGPLVIHHLFNLLGTLYGSIALELCFQALQSGDQTQEGTALEYLENTLPLELRNALWPAIAVPGAPEKTGRSPRQMLRELLRVSARAGRQPTEHQEETLPDELLATGAVLTQNPGQRQE